CLQTKNSPFSF
nr:immunoglobulin light chain junction region [Macaca mulatta]